MKQEYIEQIYAGWLSKIIGIRLGAPIEGWTYQKIRDILGEVNGYPVSYKTFAADDDSNGPLFFLRSVEDSKKGENIEAQDVAEALLNYAPFEHGFFWWGGYGISTEHTAYLNLRNGIKAPRSGSIEQNGSAAAEQIGGQIFIDTWGLVNPGNPDRAAKMAQQAASVTHGGNAIYGGMFVAACIAYAFVEKDIEKIIFKGLSYIPEDCEYSRVVRAVVDFYHSHPENWRDCFDYIFQNFGYDKYPGACHIIPNIAVMILGMLYGKGDYSDTLNITNMCGWDTDCNVGNVATIMGIICGLEGMDYDKWRAPIDDVLICSSCIGSLNIMDIPYGALYITKLAYQLDGEEIPSPYKEIIENRIDSCHFEFPGSTHHVLARSIPFSGRNSCDFSYTLKNSTEQARTGEHSLKFSTLCPFDAAPDGRILIYKKTYYESDDFSDSRYDPEFSALVYPGMKLHASIYVPDYGFPASLIDGIPVKLYVHERHSDKILESDPVYVSANKWFDLEWQIPSDNVGQLLDEAGIALCPATVHGNNALSLTCFVDDLYYDGAADYTLDFSKEHADFWGGLHTNISQLTKLKGLMYLENGQLNLSCADFAEAYTGRYDWTDYSVTCSMTPLTGANLYVNARVQGAIRSYAAGFLPDGKFGILKNAFGYKTLCEVDFPWDYGTEYDITVSVKGNCIEATVGNTTLSFVDDDDPYLVGMIGVAVENGSHAKYRQIKVH